ncbi:MAG: nuclear transport factor 2 family protein [Acidobacteriota bacterium]|nr:MAG: nuclear transport factor 2 family protein [Acidobacteriota bacterium]
MTKYFTAAFLIILTFTVSGLSQTSADRAVALAKEREAEVGKAFERLIEGIRQADVEKVMSVYHKDDRTLFFNYNGTATIGWQQMYENRKSSYEKRSNTSLETTGVRIEILSPTSAYVSCKWKQTQEFEGKLEQSSGRMTLVFKRIDGEWKVLHLHTSPDTFPSAVMVPASEKDQ